MSDGHFTTYSRFDHWRLRRWLRRGKTLKAQRFILKRTRRDFA